MFCERSLIYEWISFLLNYVLYVEVDSCRGFYSVKGFWPRFNVNFSLLDVRAASKQVIDQHLIFLRTGVYAFVLNVKLLTKSFSKDLMEQFYLIFNVFGVTVACTDFRMLEKFEIHSQLEKKDCLQRLCEQFLAAPCFEGRDTGKVSSNLL